MKNLNASKFLLLAGVEYLQTGSLQNEYDTYPPRYDCYISYTRP